MSMLDRCRQRCRQAEEDEGFTLIELLVVLLIIGILLAIAIPTFLSVVNGANSTAAQSNLQTALTGTKAFYTQNSQTYTGVCGDATGPCVSTGIPSVDINLSTVQAGTTSTDPHMVSIAQSADGTTVVIVSQQSGTKNCWGIYDTTSTATVGSNFTGPGTLYFVQKAVGAGTCHASTYLATTGTNDSLIITNLTGTSGAYSTNGFPSAS